MLVERNPVATSGVSFQGASKVAPNGINDFGFESSSLETTKYQGEVESRFQLRELVGKMASHPDFRACDHLFMQLGLNLSLPLSGLVPDISRPYFDVDVDAFFRRHGWPEDLLKLWWERLAPIKTGLYIRCRFAHLPFVTNIAARGRRGESAEEREMTSIFLKHNLSTVVTIPVHLPRGQIALLVLAGDAPAGSTRKMLEVFGPDLLAGGHYMINAWFKLKPVAHALEEELSRLTQREWDCLRLLAQGHRDGEISRLNKISPTTVRFHIDNVVRKLGAANRYHAVALASQFGMIGPLGA